ncbi:class I SAM-dependent DNA methyltransferase [Terribacillus halophilus]|jgi:SAM-dependent methyltransferase|uniref:class I SAM-dependent DNA methyltransferase n=1 Tax=Terribacillus halophilus TaxID=361279 RepID=UPI0009864A5F|nr:class I SAM-dependent methyltransferase [Terribacillus halophilus]
MAAYERLAAVYERLMQDAPYEEWQQFMQKIFQRYAKISIKTVADLGCGTGYVTRQLAESGYQMTGIDQSENMLAYAASMDDKQAVRWVQQDLRSLENIQADAAISMFDVVNYITSPEDVQAAFGRIWDMLAPGGVFLFDVHTIRHIEEDLAGELFAEVHEDLAYTWFCEAGQEQGEVFHDLTFFTKELESEKYDRFDEYHHQRTYLPDTYKKWLESAGFQVCGLFGDFDIEKTEQLEQADRLFFACLKNQEA